jgi:hypothetical protein
MQLTPALAGLGVADRPDAGSAADLHVGYAVAGERTPVRRIGEQRERPVHQLGVRLHQVGPLLGPGHNGSARRDRSIPMPEPASYCRVVNTGPPGVRRICRAQVAA